MKLLNNANNSIAVLIEDLRNYKADNKLDLEIETCNVDGTCEIALDFLLDTVIGHLVHSQEKLDQFMECL